MSINGVTRVNRGSGAAPQKLGKFRVFFDFFRNIFPKNAEVVCNFRLWDTLAPPTPYKNSF